MAREANQLGMDHYGGESIPFHQFESWRAKNANIVGCLTATRGNVVGYFDVLPLESAFLAQFIAGRLVESEISHEDVLTAEQAVACEQLYLASIAVPDPDTFIGQQRAAVLIWGLLRYLQHFYPGDQRRKLFALAATDKGEKAVQTFGFKIHTPGSARKDGHDLYVRRISTRILAQELKMAPNWESLCQLSWESKAGTAAFS
jgi:hypothetical protein